ncbi:MAG: DUF2934 domain-containing protein [candidate division NC10 bacterium]|nr:DUF2934 domain-containing protein [candidate division NC10 bacterium]
MPKPGTPRKIKRSEGPTARRERNTPGRASGREETSTDSTIPHEEIADRAYALFLARGGQHGEDLADWFRAEAELLEERNPEGRPSEK